MTLYKNRYRIESARCPSWDYASNGWYFVTLCTRDRRCFLGAVVAGKMQLSAAGEIVQKIWEEIPRRFPHVVLDNFVAMPNHIHGIVRIDRDTHGTDRDNPGRDAINRVSTGDGGDGVDRGGVTGNHNPMLSDGSLSQIMRWYKGRCTFEIRLILPEFGWQPRFHDHIIRDERALNRIRHYIATNPQKWNGDRHYQPRFPNH